MSRVKEILVKVIPSKIANEFVKKYHYSGKVVPKSNLHFGCFLDNKLHGVLSYGSPMDIRKTITLVNGTGWNEMIELNRMAFDNYLPKNSESRCISVSIKLIKKNAPHIKWVLSFSDGSQCGDGTIYRASGFLLTSIKKNTAIYEFPDGARVASNVLTSNNMSTNKMLAKKYGATLNGGASVKPFKDVGAKLIPGFQLRYIYLIDKSCKINVPILPFSKIDELNAGMYKGEKISLKERKEKSVISIDSDATPFQEDKAGQFRP